MYKCSSSFRISSFGYIQCNSATSFFFVIYRSLELKVAGGEKVWRESFSRQSGVEGNLCASLSFETSATSAGMASHF